MNTQTPSSIPASIQQLFDKAAAIPESDLPTDFRNLPDGAEVLYTVPHNTRQLYALSHQLTIEAKISLLRVVGRPGEVRIKALTESNRMQEAAMIMRHVFWHDDKLGMNYQSNSEEPKQITVCKGWQVILEEEELHGNPILDHLREHLLGL